MEDFILIILTSTLVSGLITLLLGHLFESRRYLKDKKVAAYSDYVNKLNGLLYPKKDDEELRVRFYRALAELERSSWTVALLSKKKVLVETSETIVSNYRTLLNSSVTKQNLDESERAKLKKINALQTSKREEFIKLANSDINAWW